MVSRKSSIATWCFAVVVVRDGDRFLLVHERKHGQGWYLPAGRVEPGESFPEAARRETLEETGIPVVLEGVLRVEHTPEPDGSARLRMVFRARPRDATPPKSVADEHSLEARWFTIEEVEELRLRGEGIVAYLRMVEAGAEVLPMEGLGPELG